MHPSSCNTMLTLLSIQSKLDHLGNKRFVITHKHEIFGLSKSITSKEFSSSVMLNKIYDRKVSVQAFLYRNEKYALIGNTIYKIERTYLSGQFIEFYLTETNLNYQELKDV